MSELPKGWSETTIGDIAEYISRGKSPKYAIESSLPVVNQKAIRWFGIQDEHLKYVHEDQFSQWSEDRFIRDGDILWNSTGTGTIGRACLVRPEHLSPPKVVDSHVTIVRSNGAAVDPRYLFSWIRGPEVQGKIEDLATGTTNQIELNRSMVASTRIPLAPLNEQKRIADKLDAVLARVDACREHLDRVPAILKRFRQAVLAAATSGRLTEEWRTRPDIESAQGLPSIWKVCLIKDAGRVQLGRQRSPKFHAGDNMRPYLRVQNIFEDRLDLSDVMEMDFPGQDIERYELHSGDILLNEGQSPQFLGRPAMYRGELPGVCFTNTLIRFQAFPIVKPDFALLVFRHQMHSGRYRSEGTITTNIAHLGAGRFGNVEFPLPPLEEQTEIVRRVEALFAYADRLETRYATARAQVERLTPALLAKAFRGELVEQDPNDEPASELLARLQAARTAAPAKPTTTRKRKQRAAIP